MFMYKVLTLVDVFSFPSLTSNSSTERNYEKKIKIIENGALIKILGCIFILNFLHRNFETFKCFNTPYLAVEKKWSQQNNFLSSLI